MLGYWYSKFFNKYIRWKSIFRCELDKTAKVGAGTNIRCTSMGRYSYCGGDCTINNARIGSFCSISDHVYIGGEEHPMSWVSTSPVFQNVNHSGAKNKIALLDLPAAKITTIGNDVWIGHGASVKQGVSIGDGAVIAMGAVVTKDVPPYAIVAGVPAKIVRFRFNDDTIQKLLNCKWWEWNEKKLREHGKIFNNPTLFLSSIPNN